MPSKALNQTKARRYAGRARAAFLLVALASIGGTLWLARNRQVPTVQPLHLNAPVITERTDQHRVVLVDAHGVSKRLNDIANPPVPPAEKGEDYPKTDGPPPVAATDQTIHFFGLLLEPNRKLALLKVGDRQRLVGAGDSIPTEQNGHLRVVEIAEDHVIVEENSVQKRVEKSTSQGPAVTYLSGSAPSARPGPVPVMADPTARARGNVRPGQNDPPIVPPPAARIMPGDRRPLSETTGERQ